MTSQSFFLCSSCKNLFLLEPQNANFCPQCGAKNISEVEGRFILRCKQCGLTQNKRAFTKLHGELSLRCQSSSCNGSINAIVIKPKGKRAKKKERAKDIPKIPNRRNLVPKIDHEMYRSQKLSNDQINDNIIIPKEETNEEKSEEQVMPKEKDHASLRKGDFLKLNDDWYKIDKKLGTGGMGAVWRGNPINGEKSVAVKEFFYTRYHDPETGKNHCERYWKREGKISKIQTESLEPSMEYIGSIKIDKFKIPEYFIFLEYIRGNPMDEWFTARYNKIADLTIKELRMILRDILQPIARHMYYVHQKGIIHRDLTVQNILIQEMGENKFRPIIIDWGVAKERPKEAIYEPRKPYYVASTPEATGIRNRGTPPEVMAGFQPIAATDVYMLGHIMFYVFSGGNYAGTAATHQDFVLHPADYNPNLPPDFNKVVEYMTQYEPADRMPNMIKVHEALQWLYDVTAVLEHPDIEKPKYYLYCDWNEAYIEIPHGDILKIGRDEIISHGKNHEMDGHLYRAFVSTEDDKFQLALFIEDEYLYVRDLHSKQGTFVSKLTSANQQVYNNIPIKGLDNVVIILSEANLGVTVIEAVYNAPDGKIYKIPFKIVKKENE